jgi:hypothetical protein
MTKVYSICTARQSHKCNSSIVPPKPERVQRYGPVPRGACAGEPSNSSYRVADIVPSKISVNIVPTREYAPQEAGETFRLVVTECGVSH